MDDPKLISLFSNLKGRDLRSEGLMIAEGKFLTEELIALKMNILAVLCEKKLEEHFTGLSEHRFPILAMDKAGISAVAGFPFERSVLCASQRPLLSDFTDWIEHHPDTKYMTICPRIYNEENLGSIIRSSAGLGAEAVCLGPECQDPFSRRSLKVSMGAVLRIPLSRYDNFNSFTNALKSRGFTLAAAVLDPDAVPLDRYSPDQKKIALFLGSEEKGLTPDEVRSCDVKLRIPMHNRTDSLNVGVAAGIFCYHLFKGDGA
ncbi:MAG: RNA methyltransferase [bacterium]|nr:RNA methyltransferase [bacterium]